MVPVVKKGGREVVEQHKGITLMLTLYKICASALAERLREELVYVW